MDLAHAIVIAELKYGATLYRHQQQSGGHEWKIYGARVTPASLNRTCEGLVKLGEIVQLPGSREQWVLWQNLKK